MKNENPSTTRLALITGFLICLAMIAYFLIMKLAGLVEIAELRLLNVFIMMGGCALAIRYYNATYNRHIQYLEGIMLSFLSINISAFIFAIFIFIYLSQLDPVLLDALKSNAPVMGKYLTPFSAAFSLIVEGVIAGLIVSFVLMQYFKDDSLHNPGSYLKPKDNLSPEKE